MDTAAVAEHEVDLVARERQLQLDVGDRAHIARRGTAEAHL